MREFPIYEGLFSQLRNFFYSLMAHQNGNQPPQDQEIQQPIKCKSSLADPIFPKKKYRHVENQKHLIQDYEHILYVFFTSSMIGPNFSYSTQRSSSNQVVSSWVGFLNIMKDSLQFLRK